MIIARSCNYIQRHKFMRTLARGTKAAPRRRTSKPLRGLPRCTEGTLWSAAACCRFQVLVLAHAQTSMTSCIRQLQGGEKQPLISLIYTDLVGFGSFCAKWHVSSWLLSRRSSAFGPCPVGLFLRDTGDGPFAGHKVRKRAGRNRGRAIQ